MRGAAAALPERGRARGVREIETSACERVGVCVTINSVLSSESERSREPSATTSPLALAERRRLHIYLVLSLRYAIKSARSSGFLRPAKTIFVPGMYFFGFNR